MCVRACVRACERASVRACVRACVCFHIISYVNCFGRTVLYVCTCIEYCIDVFHVSAQGIDERMINVHYY